MFRRFSNRLIPCMAVALQRIKQAQQQQQWPLAPMKPPVFPKVVLQKVISQKAKGGTMAKELARLFVDFKMPLQRRDGSTERLFNVEETTLEVQSMPPQQSSIIHQAEPCNPLGQPFCTIVSKILTKVAQEKNFTSRVWLTRSEAAEVGVQIKQGECGVAPQTMGFFHALYNASQTTDPSKFELTQYEATRPHGPVTQSCELLRLKNFADEKGFESSVWMTAEEIEEYGGTLIGSATGIEVPTKKRQLAFMSA